MSGHGGETELYFYIDPNSRIIYYDTVKSAYYGYEDKFPCVSYYQENEFGYRICLVPIGKWIDDIPMPSEYPIGTPVGNILFNFYKEFRDNMGKPVTEGPEIIDVPIEEERKPAYQLLTDEDLEYITDKFQKEFYNNQTDDIKNLTSREIAESEDIPITVSDALQNMENEYNEVTPNVIFKREQAEEISKKVNQFFDYYGITKIILPPTQQLNDPDTFASINDQYVNIILKIDSALENVGSRLRTEPSGNQIYFENFAIYSKLLDLLTEMLADVQYFMSFQNSDLDVYKIVYRDRYNKIGIINKYDQYSQDKEMFEKRLLAKD